MKNKKLFLKIYLILIIIIFISITLLAYLGNKSRIGYLSNFKLDIDKTLELNNLEYKINQLDKKYLKDYILTNESIYQYNYYFELKYYDKVFKSSDLYGVYINTNKILKDYDFIKKISISVEGGRFGNLVSSKIIDFENIDNISYSLKLKNNIIFIYFSILIFFLFILKADYLLNKFENNFNNKILFFIKIILFIIYVISIIIFINFHEPWRDEGQTWLLARDLNWLDLFLQTGAEGHPFLWSFILKPFIHFNFEIIYIINAIIMFLAVYLLIFKLNLGFLFSIIILFSPMVFYEYPVVARHYGITFLLLISMISVYKQRFEKPILYTLIIFLFINSTVMGSIICILESFIFLYDIMIREYKGENSLNKYKLPIFIIIFSITLISFQILIMFYIRVLFHQNINIFPNDNSFYIFATIIVALEFLFLYLIVLYLPKKIKIKEYSPNIIIFIKIAASVTMSLVVNSVYPMEERHIFIIFIYIVYLILNYFKDNLFIKNKLAFYYIYIFLILITINLYKIDSTYNLIKDDINNDFSGAKKAASYIKKNNLDDTNKYFIITHDNAPWTGAISIYFNKQIINFTYKQKPGSFTDYRYWAIRNRFADYGFLTNLNNKTIISIGYIPIDKNINHIKIKTFNGIRETIELYLITNK